MLEYKLWIKPDTETHGITFLFMRPTQFWHDLSRRNYQSTSVSFNQFNIAVNTSEGIYQKNTGEK